jgi:CPA1 family monovalent cation:H+ antiporter
VWEVAVFVLNVLAFILIGLQLRGIVTRLSGGHTNYVLGALAVCAATIGVRVLFWLPFTAVVHRIILRTRSENAVSSGGGLVIAWCGMRGIVTLAAALALPDGPSAFPHRDFIVLAAFSVVLCTLVLQGLSLGPLMRRLSLRDEGSVERELRMARIETARAALAALAGSAAEPAAGLLRREYAARMRFEETADQLESTAGDGLSLESTAGDGLSLAALQREAALAQRQRLVVLRAESVIGDDAFHAAEAEIDLLELSADGRIHPGAEEDATGLEPESSS